MPNHPSIDPELIARLCEMAQIELSPERRDEVQRHLHRVIEAFSELSQADLPAATGDGPALPLRPDQSEPPPPLAEVLANSPQTAADCFVVPRVVQP